MFSSEELLPLIGKFLSTTVCYRKRSFIFLSTDRYVKFDVLHILKFIFTLSTRKHLETLIEFIGQIMLSLGYGETLRYT